MAQAAKQLMRRGIIVVSLFCSGLSLTATPSRCCAADADQPGSHMPQKIAGLPIGIIKEAFSHPDPILREKLLMLLGQRIVRNNGSRQQFLSADVNDAAQLLVAFEHSTEMLAIAKTKTDDTAIRSKLTQIIQAIETARLTAP